MFWNQAGRSKASANAIHHSKRSLRYVAVPKCLLTPILLLCSTCSVFAANSNYVFEGNDGKLRYYPLDSRGNTVIDFSNVGYGGGGVEIPWVEAIETLNPIDGGGDDTQRIQAALDLVGARPFLSDGRFRGAVFLRAGEYRVAGSLHLVHSGVVLRGEGDEEGGTVIHATGTEQRTLIEVAGSGLATVDESTAVRVTASYTPVGARVLQVESGHGFAVGDEVRVTRASTEEWIAALGMDTIPNGKGWLAADYAMAFHRRVVAVHGAAAIELDAPMVQALEAEYGGATVARVRNDTEAQGEIAHCGVEGIRAVSAHVGEADEAHAWSAVAVERARHTWVRHVTAEHFAGSLVHVGSGARHCTVQDCAWVAPASKVEEGRREAILVEGALALVQRCYADRARHAFSQGARAAGPNVFRTLYSTNSLGAVGPHRQWAVGTLWEGVVVEGGAVAVQDRWDEGAGHGWAGGNQVLWNCEAEAVVCQATPTALNLVAGCRGLPSKGAEWFRPEHPNAEFESHGSPVAPASLYLAQLRERLGPLAVAHAQNRSFAPPPATPQPALPAVETGGNAALGNVSAGNVSAGNVTLGNASNLTAAPAAAPPQTTPAPFNARVAAMPARDPAWTAPEDASSWDCDVDCGAPSWKCIDARSPQLTELDARCKDCRGLLGWVWWPCETAGSCRCVDVDQCEAGPCHADATCVDFAGSYACSCNPGFEGDGFHCAVPPTSPPETTTAANGTDQATPPPREPATTPPPVTCEDDPCAADATCIERWFPRGARCECNAGFLGDGSRCLATESRTALLFDALLALRLEAWDAGQQAAFRAAAVEALGVESRFVGFGPGPAEAVELGATGQRRLDAREEALRVPTSVTFDRTLPPPPPSELSSLETAIHEKLGVSLYFQGIPLLSLSPVVVAGDIGVDVPVAPPSTTPGGTGGGLEPGGAEEWSTLKIVLVAAGSGGGALLLLCGVLGCCFLRPKEQRVACDSDSQPPSQPQPQPRPEAPPAASQGVEAPASIPSHPVAATVTESLQPDSHAPTQPLLLPSSAARAGAP